MHWTFDRKGAGCTASGKVSERQGRHNDCKHEASRILTNALIE